MTVIRQLLVGEILDCYQVNSDQSEQPFLGWFGESQVHEMQPFSMIEKLRGGGAGQKGRGFMCFGLFS